MVVQRICFESESVYYTVQVRTSAGHAHVFYTICMHIMCLMMAMKLRASVCAHSVYVKAQLEHHKIGLNAAHKY